MVQWFVQKFGLKRSELVYRSGLGTGIRTLDINRGVSSLPNPMYFRWQSYYSRYHNLHRLDVDLMTHALACGQRHIVAALLELQARLRAYRSAADFARRRLSF